MSSRTCSPVRSSACEVEERIRHDALHDALTGLPNRTLLLDRLRIALARARRDGRGRRALPRPRPPQGRQRLASATTPATTCCAPSARACAEACAPSDTVARFGGDEFAVLLQGVAGERGAIARRRADRAAFEEPFSVGGRDALRLGQRRPRRHRPGRHARARGAAPDADAAMYRAKERGPRALRALRRRAARPHHRAAAAWRPTCAARWRAATSCGSPTSRSSTLPRRGSPAWRRCCAGSTPSAGSIAPGEFIPVAEESGLIVELGACVLRAACAQVARWQAPRAAAAAADRQRLRAARSRRPPRRRRRAPRSSATGLPADALGLEITEGAAARGDAGDRAGDPRAARRSACGSILDDFGTGYSSLRYLQRYPLDGLKVDRVVRRRPRPPTARRRRDREAIVGMARALGMRVIPEGVETAGQLDAAGRAGLRLRAGVPLSRPLPPERPRGAAARRERGAVLTEPEGVALSEVLGALSYALDLTEGQPLGHAVRTLPIGMRLAEELGLPTTQRSALFYALLLKDAGCSSNAARLSSLFGGRRPPGQARREARSTGQAAARSRSRARYDRARARSAYAKRGGSQSIARRGGGHPEMIGTRCERGADIARMLELPARPAPRRSARSTSTGTAAGTRAACAARRSRCWGGSSASRRRSEVFSRTRGPHGATRWRASAAAAGSTRRWSTRCSPSARRGVLGRRSSDAGSSPPAAAEPADRVSCSPTSSARPRRDGVRPRDRREVALHGPPLERRRRARPSRSAGSSASAPTARCATCAAPGCCTTSASSASPTGSSTSPGSSTPTELAAMREPSRCHTSRSSSASPASASSRDRRRPPRAPRRQRLPPRPGGLRPLAGGAHPRRRRRLRGADRRAALRGAMDPAAAMEIVAADRGVGLCPAAMDALGRAQAAPAPAALRLAG